MGLTKPNQEPRRDLKEAAALLKWSGVDIMPVATRLSEAGLEDDAQKLMKIALSFQETEDKLAGYAEEVKVGRIVPGKEWPRKIFLEGF
ncbi:hypothetical protein [Pseudomonas protegens]|uniref:hypothetical protein n=1 Tax=Pseudomonas protegens TaxID=380021 RepID=UPI00276909EE|nr:hypothetical protein [Pseudomonas protegens]MDP9514684.1 hypothetical protein [Pseudomonas protegens]